MPPALEGGAAFHARLLRLWHAGERDAVERALAPIVHIPFWRLLLQAARTIRRCEQDGAAAPLPPGAPEQLVILHAMLDFGHVEAARACAAATPVAHGGPAGLASLRLLLARVPEPGPEDGFADDVAEAVQIVPRHGADVVLFVFTSGFHKFHVPLTLMHRWFRPLGVSVVYLRDFDRLYFLQGIRALGDGYAATVHGLQAIAARLGATAIGCIGASSGSYGAMRLGCDIGAGAVLCLAGPSMIDESIPDLLAQERLRGPFATPIDPASLNLAPRYEAASAPPQLRMIFGQDNAIDRAEAANMRHLPNAALFRLPGLASHSVVPRLVTDGTFTAHLRWTIDAARKKTLSRERERVA
jgi:hypothetical protein